MPLLDVALRLNSWEKTKTVAAEKEMSEAARLARKVDLYRQYGPLWFESLAQAVDSLILKFNEMTGDHTKLHRRVSSTACADNIIVELLKPMAQPATVPSCFVYRNEPELQVVLEIQKAEGAWTDSLEVLPTEKFEIKVIVAIQSHRTIFAEDEGRKLTGDMLMDYRTITEKTTKRLDAKEFADYVLTTFVGLICQ